jgi:phospholipid/cholesterol/gamma-HCH transport system substrate-binding protein
MAQIGIEARVGIFVLLALLVLVGFVLMLGDFSISPGYQVFADYGYAGGLQVGAPVKLSGVKVGRVAGIEILSADAKPGSAPTLAELGRDESPRVRARLVLDASARPLITSDVRFYIGMQGLIGETYVELDPGPLAVGKSALAEGTSVRGVDAPRLHVVVLEVSALINMLGNLAGVGQGAGLARLAESLRNLIDTVGGIASERKGELSAVVADAAAIAADMRVVSAKLRGALEGGDNLKSLLEDGSATAALVRRDLPSLMEHTRTSLEAVEALSVKAKAAADEANIAELARELKATLDNLNQVTLDARKVMDTIRRGQGTLGGAVTDPQVYDDLKDLLRDLKKNPWKLLWRE